MVSRCLLANLREQTMRFRIEWIPNGETAWEDSYQYVDSIDAARRVKDAWKRGVFTYRPPVDVRIFDMVENKVVE